MERIGLISYVNGKVFYDFGDDRKICMSMLYDLVEDMEYEKAGRINICLLLPRMQINEHELKLIAQNNDNNCIRGLVREGHILSKVLT